MSDDECIKQRIATAKTKCPLVTQAVLARIEELLRGRLSEGEVSKGTLATIAKDLLGKMVPESPEAEDDQ